MTEHIAAEERMLEQRRTLYTDLRSAEAKEASCVEKRLSDEQTTATRLAEEHDACRRAAEAEASKAAEDAAAAVAIQTKLSDSAAVTAAITAAGAPAPTSVAAPSAVAAGAGDSTLGSASIATPGLLLLHVLAGLVSLVSGSLS